MKTPGSLIEFMTTFRTEQDCRDALFRHRWPDGFTCPRCGGRDYYPIETRLTYQCASCRYQVSLTAGTVFQEDENPAAQVVCGHPPDGNARQAAVGRRDRTAA